MAVDQKVSKYMRQRGPSTDWYLAAQGAQRAFEQLVEAIKREGFQVLYNASDDTYSLIQMDRRAALLEAQHRVWAGGEDLEQKR